MPYLASSTDLVVKRVTTSGESHIEPEWNFYKYLFDHEGKLVKVFPSQTSVEEIFDVVERKVRLADKEFIKATKFEL